MINLPSNSNPSSKSDQKPERVSLIDELIHNFDQSWKQSDQPPLLEEFLVEADYPNRKNLLSKLLEIEFLHLKAKGQLPLLDDYLERFPEEAEVVSQQFANDVDHRISSFSTNDDLTHPTFIPEHIDRYQVLGRLGDEKRSRTFLALDRESGKRVSIKVLTTQEVDPENFEILKKETDLFRILGKYILDSDHTLGLLPDKKAYIVREYIHGRNFLDWLWSAHYSLSKRIEILLKITQALKSAHEKGIYHLQLKPQNILIDSKEDVYLCDFSIQHLESSLLTQTLPRGNIAYRAPEQVANYPYDHGHLTDIWSLGVVLFQLLYNQLPYQGPLLETREQLASGAPILFPQSSLLPPSLIKLTESCLKHDPNARLNSIEDFEAGIKSWLEHFSEDEQFNKNNFEDSNEMFFGSSLKGIKTYKEFLKLLPGPLTPSGLPRSIQFWKDRIESFNPEVICSPAVLFGPLGSGKTSYVKRGLIPSLSSRVTPVFITASATGTEEALLRSIRLHFPEVGEGASLVESISRLHDHLLRNRNIQVILIIDQFERWLQAHNPNPLHDLVRVLKRCDGQFLKSLLVVQDNFWLALNRLLHETGTPMREGQNLSMIDLFDRNHAREVLQRIGMARGFLPSDGNLKESQKQFIYLAVDELEENGYVTPARLMLLVESMQELAWSPFNLKKLGGLKGLGLRILEGAFSIESINPRARHQRAAIQVLQSLIPLPSAIQDQSTQLRSVEELKTASGYEKDSHEFYDLIEYLESDLRLITVVDFQGHSIKESGGGSLPEEQRYYRITQDYLVPVILQWIQKTQEKSHFGRAERILSEKSIFWSLFPNDKFLLTFTEWVYINIFTSKPNVSVTQKTFLKENNKRYSRRLLIASILGIFIVGAVWIGAIHIQNTQVEKQSHHLVNNLISSNAYRVPNLLSKLEESKESPWIYPLLQEKLNDDLISSENKTRLQLATLSYENTQLDSLIKKILNSSPQQNELITNELWRINRIHPTLEEKLWEQIESKTNEPKKIMRALCALPNLPRHAEKIETKEDLSGMLTSALLAEDLLDVDYWVQRLKPIRDQFLDNFIGIFYNRQQSQAGVRASQIISELAADQLDLLLSLYLDSNIQQAPPLLEKIITQHPFASWKDKCLRVLGWDALELDSLIHDYNLKSAFTETGNEDLLRLRTKAGIALFMMGETGLLESHLFPKWDQTFRTYLIAYANELDLPVKLVLEQFLEIRQARYLKILLYAIGLRKKEDYTIKDRQVLLKRTEELFLTHPNSGVHSAAEWLLRRWNETKVIDKAFEESTLPFDSCNSGSWYVTSERHTMSKVRYPQGKEASKGYYGVPKNQKELEELTFSKQNEIYLKKEYVLKPGSEVAMSTHEITRAQFNQFYLDYYGAPKYLNASKNLPAVRVTWLEAAQYCRWLSEREGIPEDEMCYPPIDQIDHTFRFNIKDKQKTGYRLPSKDEWEVFCRAGTVTSRYFGTSHNLTYMYAHSKKNSPAPNVAPVGTYIPNDWGLFDTLGNVWEWTLMQQDGRNDSRNSPNSPLPNSPLPGNLQSTPQNGNQFISAPQRGGSFRSRPMYLTAFSEQINLIEYENSTSGFRIARTLPQRSTPPTW